MVELLVQQNFTLFKHKKQTYSVRSLESPVKEYGKTSCIWFPLMYLEIQNQIIYYFV